MPETTESTEQTAKESKFRKFGPIIFWGTVVALPAMNLTASVLNYKTTKMTLELEKLTTTAQQVKDLV